MNLDPALPYVWHLKRVRAIVGLQQGDKAPASEFLQFVEQHRGRKHALEARDGLRAAAKHPAWAKFDEKSGQTNALKTLIQLERA